MPLLDGLRVLDFSTEIAGPYCTKLLADAGADVVKVERPGGDGLRRWEPTGQVLDEDHGVLFEYLNAGKRSIVGAFGNDEVDTLLAGADVLVEDGSLADAELAAIVAAHPALVVVSITPFGRRGPWTDVPATEFTLQALCGSIAGRGDPAGLPFFAGGRLGEWMGGVFAAVLALALTRGARASGIGDHADLSIFEVMCVCMSGSSGAGLKASLAGSAPSATGRAVRTFEVPSIEPTADGLVGFCTVTRQQFLDFLVLIDRPDLADDPTWADFPKRFARRSEFLGMVREWTTKRPTHEIEELASLLRVPVAPIGRPETVADLAQFRDRGVFVGAPSGRFRQPRPPYVLDGEPVTLHAAAPLLGEHDGRVAWSPRNGHSGARADALPLSGVRVIDLTAFWAGPIATHVLAALGADVVKVESARRPDGMRFNSTKPPDQPSWFEWSGGFLANNLNKRGVTLDLATQRGVDLLLELVETADVLIENYSPRVLDNFGITWDRVHARNPRVVMVRMPAFGLTGPWRDRTGFAQTMEQASGMAWMTGFPDQIPVIVRGACDPVAGLHASFALLAALDERDRTGIGRHVESTMVEAALNVAAELSIEYSAHGISLCRDGNRGPSAAPQGIYPCAAGEGRESWLALAVRDDDDWIALRTALGDPAWARDARLAHPDGRRAAHDLIDSRIAEWTRDRDLDAAVAALQERGIPTARVVEPAVVTENDQLRARGFVEMFDHPVVGRHETFSMPFSLASRDSVRWYRTPAPLLGQHNREVLCGELGLSDETFEELTAAGIVGDELG